MRGRSNTLASRRATPLVAPACLLAASLALLAPASAAAASRLHPRLGGSGASVSAATQERRVLDYWTPQRMRDAVPLGGSGSAPRRGLLSAPLDFGGAEASASASYAEVPDSTVPPFSQIGRIFVKQGPLDGYCSGTAINSATRRLVLTAGHCVNSGPVDQTRRNYWSRLLEFVPAYNGGVAPYGVFVGRRSEVYAPKPWVKLGNPNFDMGAFLTSPNASGQNVADAVGGGATIVLDQPRHQDFQTFGYPGKVTQLQECDAPYSGDDAVTYRFGGPPTMAIRCRWRPGASGGGWLVALGTEVDGLTSYNLRTDKVHTFSPYFGSGNLGRLVAGM